MEYRLLAVGLLALASLTACGSTTPAPARPALPERLWVDDARRFVATLDSDIGLTVSAGPTLADARRAMAGADGIYTMLVAYSLFGDCSRALAAVGAPSPREHRVVSTLAAACSRLEHAAVLFQRAMTRNEPRVLLAATRASLGAAPLLARARFLLDE
ncbi:MAG TPA: hypothetical protein VH063_09635 [Gaiellaceae bacterium]|nr:hypothetical protein [Gaiellaceae bacterium]